MLIWADVYRLERLCRSPGFLRRVSATLLEKIKNKFGHIGEARRNIANANTYPTEAQHVAELAHGNIYHKRKGRVLSEHPVSPTVQYIAGET